MKTRSGRRALQADDDTQGGSLVDDETEEPNEPCDPDGDGDDDCNASGDSDHSHWDEQGQQIQTLPGRPLMPADQGRQVSSLRRRRADHSHEEDDCPDCPEHRWEGPNVETRWDGPAAMSSCASSSTPASCYSSICAGKRAGDPSLQSTWALPHHTHPGGPPDPAGVRNALARLGSTQGLTNRSAAEAHLQRHMASISPDSEKSSASYGMERRYLPLNVLGLQVETRSDGQTRISGYSAVFNQQSQNLGFFREVVDPGAFRKTIASDDVMALFNHDPNYPLGGTRDGRLALSEDDHGLHMDVRPTATTYSRDLVTNIKDGVVRSQSFSFEVQPGGDSWDDGGDIPLRHLRTDGLRLFDVSPVVFAAYTMTDLQVRHLLQHAGLEYRGVCMAVTTAFRGLELDRIDRRVLNTVIERVPILRHALGQASGASAIHQPVPQAWSVALNNRRAELDAKTSIRSRSRGN